MANNALVHQLIFSIAAGAGDIAGVVNPIARLEQGDAVAHGLSEVPFMKEVNSWGVLTIGTGLGNARFTNREPA